MISGLLPPSQNESSYLPQEKGKLQVQGAMETGQSTPQKSGTCSFLFLPVLCTVCGHVSVERRCESVYCNLQRD